jgi:hypothetical protein
LQANAVSEAGQVLHRVEDTVAALLTGGRASEAALVRAAAESASGRPDAAISTLDRLLDQAPPGQVGWQIPVDPAIADLRTHPAFPRVLTRVAARAS